MEGLVGAKKYGKKKIIEGEMPPVVESSDVFTI
jgi:hypothetical protein